MQGLRPPSEKRVLNLQNWIEITRLPKSELTDTHLSQLSVSGSGEGWPAPKPGQVCRKISLTLTSKLYGSSRSPTGGANQVGLVDECRSRVKKMPWLVINHFGFGPWPLMSPWLPHHYRLSRLPCLIAIHCDQPQIKRWDRWEWGADYS